MRARFVSAITIIVLLAVLTNAQDSQRNNLRGIQVIEVLIQPLQSNAAGAGLNQRQLQTDVELRLRKAGLRVKDASDDLTPYLAVSVNTVNGSGNLSNAFAVSTHVELKRAGKFGTEFIFATIWSDAFVSIGGKNRVEEGVRQQLADLVDEFINDYLAVNPKP